jgi:hypothetical protein
VLVDRVDDGGDVRLGVRLDGVRQAVDARHLRGRGPLSRPRTTRAAREIVWRAPPHEVHGVSDSRVSKTSHPRSVALLQHAHVVRFKR